MVVSGNLRFLIGVSIIRESYYLGGGGGGATFKVPYFSFTPKLLALPESPRTSAPWNPKQLLNFAYLKVHG